MARYPLSLPNQLKQEAEALAAGQGISLNQFVLWAVAEKVGSLRSLLDDPAFPRITYRRGASGRPRPVLRGTNLRVQTIVVATKHWDQSRRRLPKTMASAKPRWKRLWLSIRPTAKRSMPPSRPKKPWSQNVTRLRLHLDADASRKQLHTALTKRGHDVTRTPNSWMPLDASDEAQLLGATAQGRCIFTFNIEDFVRLAQRHSQHGGIILAAQSKWSLSQLIAALDRVLTETEAEDWIGQVRWLSQWRR